MKLVAALVLTTLAFPAFISDATAALAQSSANTPISSAASYGKLPLSFEANQGQTDASVQFVSHGQGYTLFLRPSEAVLALQNSTPSPGKQVAGKLAPADPSTLRLRLIGANESAAVAPEGQQVTRTNYFLGNGPAKWRTNIPNYGRIHYSNVYPGIDLVYYGNQHRLEHDFVVAPNANPSQIVLAAEGTLKSGTRTAIDSATGDLILTTSTGTLRLLKPVTYQLSDGDRTEIPSSYKLLANNRISFSIGKYNHAQPLIVDPILSYSTYLGGSGNPNFPAVGDKANGIAVDSYGKAYIIGTTQSSDFPVTSGAYQSLNKEHSNNNLYTVFVSKLNATGTALVYSTLLGGNGNKSGGNGDWGLAIALDSEHNAYLTGLTYSSDFPVTSGAFQSTNKSAAANSSTAFVTKLNATGSGLLYSTYLGGTNPNNGDANRQDQGTSIDVDSSGNAYVTGNTYDADFPVTPGAFQTTNHALSASYNAFVTKLNPTGSGLLYSTYLGGSGEYLGYIEYAIRIAIESSGNAYLAGRTYSSDFPVTSQAFQKVNHAFAAQKSNVFVTKLNSAGTAPVYSTYLGGSMPNAAGPYTYYDGDYATGIAVDSNGNAYVAGGATSKDFPVTSGVVQGTLTGHGSAFVSKLSPTGSALEYSTFLGENAAPITYSWFGSGTSGSTNATGIAIDASGIAYISGVTSLPIFPSTPDAIANTGGAVLAKLTPDAKAVSYATAFGSYSTPPTSTAITIDSAGNAYVTGFAVGSDFPTTSGAYQTVNKAAPRNGTNAFVTKFALAGDTGDHFATSMTLTASASSFQQGQPITLTAKVTANTGGITPTGEVTFSGYHESYSSTTAGPVYFSQTVPLDATGTAKLVSTTFPNGRYSATATYSGDASHLTSQGPYVLFSNLGPPANVYLCDDIQYGYLTSTESVYKYPLQRCTTVVQDSQYDPLPGVTVTFSGANLAFSPSSAVTDAKGTIALSVTGLAAGNTTATATVAGVAPSKYSSIPWSVLKAPLTVTVNNGFRFYGAANPNFAYTISGLLGSDTVTVTSQTTATPSSPVGSYPITATISGAVALNYQVTLNNATLNVLKAPLYISARNIAITYGQTPPQPTAYVLTGFVNGDTQASATTGAPTLTTTVTSASPAGFYPIKVQTGTLAAANYYFNTFSNGEGSVVVKKAPLTIWPSNFTIHVGDPLPAFTYTITGFVNGESQATATTGTPTLATAAPSTAKPGRYYIIGTAGSLSAHNYYFLPPSVATNGIVTILK